MKAYFSSRMQLVQYVDDLLSLSKLDLPLTMTITQGKSEDSYAISAITKSSEDTEQELVATFFSQTQVNI